jgi:glycosyltransferase involved in cell wall biosynthesis
VKIAVVSDWLAERMGYVENCLPKALAALGHEVHLVTSNAQIYYNSPIYKETYEPFIGPPLVATGTKQHDGYTLHRLELGNGRHPLWKGARHVPGLISTLWRLKPDIVQALEIACPTTYELACARPALGYRFFLEAHIHASVYSGGEAPSVKAYLYERLIDVFNRVTSAAVDKCYPISSDAAKVAIEHFRMRPGKVEVSSLGVDTDLFRPPTDAAAQDQRCALRRKLGFADTDVVCVYTGRLTVDKGPLILAEAVDGLVRKGLPVRGLFVGNGTADDIRRLKACHGCVLHPFVPTRDLPPFYWAAELGVWPRQESTSQLDAAACALPLILSDRVEVHERIDRNGITYREGDVASLAAAIESLLDPERRRRMGEIGSERMLAGFSWRNVATRRIQDYQAALRTSRRWAP